MFQGPARYMPTVNDATERGMVYPRRSLVLVTGVPGAGKSTLLRRLFGLRGNEERTVLTADGVRVIDSLQSRYRLGPLLDRVHYPLWRWVVHVLHLARTAAALRGGPVVAHECGTRGPVRVLLALLCRLRRYEMHVLMIDATPQEARNGQRTRGRQVTERSHQAHSRRWRRLRAATQHGAAAFAPGARSLLALDRRRARELAWICFVPGVLEALAPGKDEERADRKNTPMNRGNAPPAWQWKPIGPRPRATERSPAPLTVSMRHCFSGRSAPPTGRHRQVVLYWICRSPRENRYTRPDERP